MPLPYIKKLSTQLNVPIKTAEKYWSVAKSDQGDKGYGYVMSIFKTLMKRHASKAHKESVSTLHDKPSKIVSKSFYDLDTPLQQWNDRLDQHNYDHLGTDLVYTSVTKALSPLEAEEIMRHIGVPFRRKAAQSTRDGLTWYTTIVEPYRPIAYFNSIRNELRIHKDLDLMINPGHYYGFR